MVSSLPSVIKKLTMLLLRFDTLAGMMTFLMAKRLIESDESYFLRVAETIQGESLFSI